MQHGVSCFFNRRKDQALGVYGLRRDGKHTKITETQTTATTRVGVSFVVGCLRFCSFIFGCLFYVGANIALFFTNASKKFYPLKLTERLMLLNIR